VHYVKVKSTSVLWIGNCSAYSEPVISHALGRLAGNQWLCGICNSKQCVDVPIGHQWMQHVAGRHCGCHLASVLLCRFRFHCFIPCLTRYTALLDIFVYWRITSALLLLLLLFMIKKSDSVSQSIFT